MPRGAISISRGIQPRPPGSWIRGCKNKSSATLLNAHKCLNLLLVAGNLAQRQKRLRASPMSGEIPEKEDPPPLNMTSIRPIERVSAMVPR